MPEGLKSPLTPLISYFYSFFLLLRQASPLQADGQVMVTQNLFLHNLYLDLMICIDIFHE